MLWQTRYWIAHCPSLGIDDKLNWQIMRLYWKQRKRGFDLIVEDDNGDMFNVGGVRSTRRGGIEAMAKTLGYDPGRSIKQLPSMEDGRLFVEQFEPWRDFFPGHLLELEREVVVPEELS